MPVATTASRGGASHVDRTPTRSRGWLTAPALPKSVWLPRAGRLFSRPVGMVWSVAASRSGRATCHLPPAAVVVHADRAQGAVLARLNERGRHGRPQLGSPLELQLGDGRFTAAAGVGRILLLCRRLGASSACRVSRRRQLRHEHRGGLGVGFRRGPDQPQGARRHPGEGQQPAQSRTPDLRRPLDRLRQRKRRLHAVVRVRPLVRHATQLRRTGGAEDVGRRRWGIRRLPRLGTSPGPLERSRAAEEGRQRAAEVSLPSPPVYVWHLSTRGIGSPPAERADLAPTPPKLSCASTHCR